MKLHPNEIVLTKENAFDLLDYALSKGKAYQRALHIQMSRQDFKGIDIQNFGEGATAYVLMVDERPKKKEDPREVAAREYAMDLGDEVAAESVARMYPKKKPNV
jgi:hypothetical protein